MNSLPVPYDAMKQHTAKPRDLMHIKECGLKHHSEHVVLKEKWNLVLSSDMWTRAFAAAWEYLANAQHL